MYGLLKIEKGRENRESEAKRDVEMGNGVLRILCLYSSNLLSKYEVGMKYEVQSTEKEDTY